MGTDRSEQTTSRRDALKALAAATGAVTISFLPSGWAKPGLTVGALPAHAQTSGRTLLCGANVNGNPGPFTSTVTISPPDPGIPMHFSVVIVGSTLTSAANGMVFTNASGVASTTVTLGGFTAIAGYIEVTWIFANPVNGYGTCAQRLTWPIGV